MLIVRDNEGQILQGKYGHHPDCVWSWQFQREGYILLCVSLQRSPADSAAWRKHAWSKLGDDASNKELLLSLLDDYALRGTAQACVLQPMADSPGCGYCEAPAGGTDHLAQMIAELPRALKCPVSCLHMMHRADDEQRNAIGRSYINLVAEFYSNAEGLTLADAAMTPDTMFALLWPGTTTDVRGLRQDDEPFGVLAKSTQYMTAVLMFHRFLVKCLRGTAELIQSSAVAQGLITECPRREAERVKHSDYQRPAMWNLHLNKFVPLTKKMIHYQFQALNFGLADSRMFFPNQCNYCWFDCLLAVWCAVALATPDRFQVGSADTLPRVEQMILSLCHTQVTATPEDLHDNSAQIRTLRDALAMHFVEKQKGNTNMGDYIEAFVWMAASMRTTAGAVPDEEREAYARMWSGTRHLTIKSKTVPNDGHGSSVECSVGIDRTSTTPFSILRIVTPPEGWGKDQTMENVLLKTLHGTVIHRQCVVADCVCRCRNVIEERPTAWEMPRCLVVELDDPHRRDSVLAWSTRDATSTGLVKLGPRVQYQLLAIPRQTKKGAGTSHFIADVRLGDKWFHFDDTKEDAKGRQGAFCVLPEAKSDLLLTASKRGALPRAYVLLRVSEESKILPDSSGEPEAIQTHFVLDDSDVTTQSAVTARPCFKAFLSHLLRQRSSATSSTSSTPAPRNRGGNNHWTSRKQLTTSRARKKLAARIPHG